MSNLIMSEKVNSLGEKITHFSKRFTNAYVSYNHSDREIAIMIDGAWLPVDRFTNESEVVIKTKIAKALNCLADAVKIITDTSDQKWDKFILSYES